jgi:hypothetical protein
MISDTKSLPHHDSVCYFMILLGTFLRLISLYFVENYLLTTQSLFQVLMDDISVRCKRYAELQVFSYISKPLVGAMSLVTFIVISTDQPS